MVAESRLRLAAAFENTHAPLRRLMPTQTEAWHVFRRGLVADTLSAIHTNRVVILHALPGYGKTTLMAEVARSAPEDYIWLTLDARDREACCLIDDLALAATGSRLGIDGNGRVGDPGSQATVANIIRLANAVSNDFRRRVFVLDDLQKLEGATASMRLLGHLIRFTPDHIGFLIGTRWWDGGASLDIEPATMTVQSAPDLTFCLSELEDALAEIPSPTTTWRSVAGLSKAYHGWPAMIGEVLRACYANNTLPPHSLALMSAVPASADMLQFLSGASSDYYDLLALAANTDSVHPELIARLSGRPNVDEFIQWTRRYGLVFDTPDGGGYMRLDPVARLSILGSVNYCTLSQAQHMVAAAWYAQNGTLVPELNHRLLAGDETGSESLIDRAVATLSGPEDCEVLLDILSRYDRLTRKGLSDQLLVRKAHVALHLGLSRTVIQFLTEAIDQSDEPTGECASAFYRKRALAYRNIGRYLDADRDICHALSSTSIESKERMACLHVRATLRGTGLLLLDAECDFTDAIALAKAHGSRTSQMCLYADYGHAAVMQGLLENAASAFSNCMRYADSDLHYQSMAMARNGRGLLCQIKGDLSAGERWFSEALLIARGTEQRIVESLLWLSMADLAVERGHLEEARRMYRRALAIATIVEQPGYASYALSGLAGIERIGRRFEEAGRLLVEARDHLGPELRYDLAVFALRKAHLHLDEGNYGLAFEELDPTIDALRAGRARLDLARGLILRADASFRAYGLDAAFPDLAEIMSLVHEIGTSQFLAPYCRRMPRLLRALAASPRGSAWAGIIGLGAELAPERRNGHVTPIARMDEPDPALLNDRELEVVMALCDGLAREEVAARVGRSVSTVNKLIHGIYSATGFRATHQIVAWAYRRGLFRPSRAND